MIFWKSGRRRLTVRSSCTRTKTFRSVLQSTRVPIMLMTTRRFARQLVEWGINVDAVAAIEEVAKTFTTKPSMSGEIDPGRIAGLSASSATGRAKMMARAHPSFALRPFLIEDTPLLTEIFRASIEELTADDYSEGARRAWASAADDEEAFAKRLGDQLTLIATMNGSPVAFASLANNETIDLLYVHPGVAGQGAGTMLVDALEKLAAARGAKRLTADVSDTAQDFFKKRGFTAQQRNTVLRGGEWLANTTMDKALATGKGGRMSKERLYLFDTTLRDGAQMNGVDFTLHDKLTIARLLDGLGIDYIEGGYPGANPTDTELFGTKRDMAATFTAFGMTRRPGRSTSNDPGLATLLDAKADAICFVAKSWDYHVRVALETTNEENLASIRDSVQAAQGKKAARC